MGNALGPLRSEGVLILGSGNTHHGRSTRQEGIDFDKHLQQLRDFRDWKNHPAAIKCHPRLEHLLPLIVCAGAAAENETKVEAVPHDFMGNAASHFVFN